MIDEHHHHEEHSGHHHEEEIDESLALELDTQSRIFLDMRDQNIELLKIAAQVAGLSGSHTGLKSTEVPQVLKNLWNIYAEFYSWVDPEESEDDEDDDE
jgi:hypothetical protein